MLHLHKRHRNNRHKIEQATGSKRFWAHPRANWPRWQVHNRLSWFPPHNRLIGLVRDNEGSFVLPPAVVRKAHWRE